MIILLNIQSTGRNSSCGIKLLKFLSYVSCLIKMVNNNYREKKMDWYRKLKLDLRIFREILYLKPNHLSIPRILKIMNVKQLIEYTQIVIKTRRSLMRSLLVPTFSAILFQKKWLINLPKKIRPSEVNQITHIPDKVVIFVKHPPQDSVILDKLI